MRTLLIDNHDSYTYNLFHLIGQVNGEEPLVVANDELPWRRARRLGFDNVVISPGPGRPQRDRDLGICRELLARAEVPVLGVCLGHQALAYAHGAAVREQPPAHGRLSRIRHDGSPLFAGVPQGFAAVRYHSLAVGGLPPVLRATAFSEDDVVMALEHRERPLWGVQFHPESVCTEHGRRLLENFRDLSGRTASAAARGIRVLRAVPAPGSPTPRRRRPRAGGPTVRHRELDWPHGTEAVFGELYGGRDSVFWLDSAARRHPLARFSYMGAPDGPLGRELRHDVRAGRLEVRREGRRSERAEPLLEHARQLLERFEGAAPELPFDFTGGLVGYFGYEFRAECGAGAPHASALPDAALLFCDRLLAFDHHERRVHLVALADGDMGAADEWLGDTERRLRRIARRPSPPAGLAPRVAAPFRLRDGPAAHLARVAEAQARLAEGESYEICLTTELVSAARLDPLAAYRALRRANPAPFGALLRLGALSVLSTSPERMLRVDRAGTVEARPIKGTAPRGRDPREDAERREALRTDPKCRAENLMVADLVRHDLGRVCRLGTVEVPALMAVEAHPAVHQMVTVVQGRLREDADALDALRAAFPAGSMTGAPKARTMELIDALEGRARGVYSGGLGFLGVNGTADLSVVIRTAVASAAGISIGTGGAIVADSDPAEELEELLLKARPLVQGLGGELAPDLERALHAA